MTELAHSKLGASSMYRWSKCPGSVRECEGKENISSSYADEGTLAHEIAAEVLQTGSCSREVDPEMREHIEVYRQEILTQFKSRPGNHVLIEHRFDLSSVHPGCFGTADAIVYNPWEKILYVTDLKYGAGLPVEVENNSQLMYYGLGALLSFNRPCSFVELVVVQPRCPHKDGPVRRWRIPAIDLLDFRADLRAFAQKTEEPDAPLVPGSHCRFCIAAATCPGLKSKALAMAKRAFAADKPYEPEDLAVALSRADMVEAWAKSVRAFAYSEAQRGRVIPGYKIVQKRATRRWSDETKAAAKLEELRTQDGVTSFTIYNPPTLRSVAQIEKELKTADIAKEAIADFVISESSGTKLVPENEPGEPVKIGPAAVFS